MIQLELELEEVNSVIQVLGELPTKTGAYPLVKKIVNQVEEQQAEKPSPEKGSPEKE